MQVTLCLVFTIAAASAGIPGIPVYNKFGFNTKKIYNDFYRGQNLGYNIGLTGAIPKSFIINKDFVKYPLKQSFVYNSGYSAQQYQPINNRIVLNNVPAPNIANNIPLVRIAYPGLNTVPIKANGILYENGAVATPANYLPQNIGNIVQSKNLKVIHEDLTSTYDGATGYSTKLDDFSAKTAYVKGNDQGVLRILRSNIDVASKGSEFVAADGTLYKILPENQNSGYETLIPGSNLDGSKVDATGHLQIIKDAEVRPTYNTIGLSGLNQLRILDQPVSLNSGEVVLQQLDPDIPRNELLKLFSR